MSSGRWIPSLAWRDTRGSRRKLLLYVSSMVLGVAALVSINSFGENLRRAIDAEAASLLGADLSFESSQPFSKEIESVIDSLGGLQSRRISFSSMAAFAGEGRTRLATVRAQSGTYPYYGELETRPPDAGETYLDGAGALVDRTLMLQFGVQPGDSVRIGRKSYRVAGELLQTPRESAAMMLFSPRIYIPLQHLDRSLLRRGSRAEYEVYFRFLDGRDADDVVEPLARKLRDARVGWDTVREEREGWDRSLTNLYRFLGLAGLMALLLGSLGVSSAIHVYIRQRIQTVSVLRCLGAKSWQTFGVYLLQAFGMGLIGAGAGSLLGLGLQAMLPRVIGDFLPVYVDFTISWKPVMAGAGTGLVVTVLFALLPLLTVKDVSPLLALRSGLDSDEESERSLGWRFVVVLIGLGIILVSILQAPSVMIGLSYAVGIFIVFGLLSLVARLFIRILRARDVGRFSYVWRQGMANLYRPHNQTHLMTLSLGLGTFLIATMMFVQNTLIRQVEIVSEEGQPNLVFFDIQPDQADAVASDIEARGLPVLDRVPIVTMRLSAVKGRSIEEMRRDTTLQLNWAYRREYRSTYRSTLTATEEIIEGVFTPEYDASSGDPVPVTVEKDIAETIGVVPGDEVIFDVQGVPIKTRIAGIRSVEWRRMQTNFFFVFPRGVLEDAPQFDVLLTRADTEEQSASIQSAINKNYPNISAIDISMVLSVFETIFSRIAFVVRFMAFFSILTGFVVLAGAVMTGRYRRIEESVLLKTLGASRSQVMRIMAIEYFILGVLAVVTGFMLAIAGSWALARFVFQSPFVLAPGYLLVIAMVVIGLTMLIGLLNSRGIYSRQPLEVLRSEV